MKDQHDRSTSDLIDGSVKRGPGRPKTGNAMTPAEKQRAYRERHAYELRSMRPLAMNSAAHKVMAKALRAGAHSRPALLAMAEMALTLGVFTPDEFGDWSRKIQ